MPDPTTVLGATPGDDASGLLQPKLATREARNAAELDTISRAYNKYIFRSRRRKYQKGWLTDDLIRRVHLDMFGEIWDWAGKYRTQPLNMGVEFHLILEQIQLLCGDFEYWNSSNVSMPPVELAARLQNRLTRIHPFINGNGRHARFITDIYFTSIGHPLPQWPQIHLMTVGDQIRAEYITAMQEADQENYDLLTAFINDWLLS